MKKWITLVLVMVFAVAAFTPASMACPGMGGDDIEVVKSK